MDRSPSQSAPETLAAAWRLIIGGLLAALGGFGLEAKRGQILYNRISGIAGRIERMLIRFRAGRLRRGMQTVRRVAIRQRRIGTLPTRFGWLVISGGYRAAGFGSQLQTVLSAPEMAELLAASPQAVRLLRPLCRALAVEIPGFPKPPRKQRERQPRKPRPKPEPFRIPLPRGVISAARRAGYRKIY